jgi:hypothetical protein
MQTLSAFVRNAAITLGTLVATSAMSQAVTAQTRFDFSYAISDSRINVFDDGQTTRLQLPEGLVLPAVIARTPSGEQILTPRRDGVDLVVDGVHAQLALVWANNRQVKIQYTGSISETRQGRAAAHAALPPTQTSQALAAPIHVPTALPAAREKALSTAVDEAAQGSAPRLQVQVQPVAAFMVPDPGDKSVAVVTTAAEQAPVKPTVTATTFSVRQRDTIRETLARWAKDAGWTHLPEHYTVDFDIQLLGTVEPYADFRTGVRSLLATTSMTERPLQPCFYSNQVLRVVLRTQRCDQI